MFPSDFIQFPTNHCIGSRSVTGVDYNVCFSSASPLPIGIMLYSFTLIVFSCLILISSILLPAFFYRYLFNQVSSTPILATPSSILPPSTVSRKSLASLFREMAQIPLLLGEAEAFGAASSAVDSCFQSAEGTDSISVQAFLDWMKQVIQRKVFIRAENDEYTSFSYEFITKLFKPMLIIVRCSLVGAPDVRLASNIASACHSRGSETRSEM